MGICECCGHDDGEPVEAEAGLAAAKLIYAVHRHVGGQAGGHLHICIDDGNMRDGDLDFCEGLIAKNKYGYPKAQIKTEKACLDALRAIKRESDREVAVEIYRLRRDEWSRDRTKVPPSA